MNQRRPQPAESPFLIGTVMASSDKKSIIIRSQSTYQLSYHEKGTEGSTYKCHACKQRGCGPYYRRNGEGRTRYYYHTRCGKLLRCDSSSATPGRKHPLYPTENLVLKETEPDRVQPCVVCGDEVRMLRYEWRHRRAQGSRNTYDTFHPLCATPRLQIVVPRKHGSEHGIVLDLKKRILGKCFICNEESTGWAYNDAGNYCCHVRCMKGEIMKSLRKKEPSQKNKVTVYVKKALPLIGKVAKVALQLIAGYLLGFPLPDFELIIKKKWGSTYECNGCQQTGFGPYYSCINVGCNFHYHQHCGDLLKPDISWADPVSNHPPYPTGHLILKATVPRKVQCCVACGDHVLGLRYKVWHKKAHGSYNPFWLFRQHLSNRAFHPLCTLLPKQIRGAGTQEIELELEEGIRGECSICKGDAKGWAYNSTRGIYGYHVGCVKKKIIRSWQQEEAPGKVTIYVKKALRSTLEIAKWAFQQIIQVLVGLPAAMVVDIIVKLFDFTYE